MNGMEDTPIGRMIEAFVAVASRQPEQAEAAQSGGLVGYIDDDVLAQVDNPLGDLIRALARPTDPAGDA